MDEFALDYLTNTDEPALQEDDNDRDDRDTQDEKHPPEPAAAGSGYGSSSRRKAIHRGIFKAASMQDKLLEK